MCSQFLRGVNARVLVLLKERAVCVVLLFFSGTRAVQALSNIQRHDSHVFSQVTTKMASLFSGHFLYMER